MYWATTHSQTGLEEADEASVVLKRLLSKWSEASNKGRAQPMSYWACRRWTCRCSRSSQTRPMILYRPTAFDRRDVG